MILTEQHAYRNRWRSLPADAKAAFCALALVAAFVAPPPAAPFALAAGLAALAVLGAGIPLQSYARIAAGPAAFLGASIVALLVTVHLGPNGVPALSGVDAEQSARAVAVAGRSTAALSAMLLLALTTPMTDLIALARRMHAPETLVDIMTVSYRSLFVFAEAAHDMRHAQAARLGYASFRGAVNSLGTAVARLSTETLRRSRELHWASVARGGDGRMRFLPAESAGGGRRALALALAAGTALVLGCAALPGGAL